MLHGNNISILVIQVPSGKEKDINSFQINFIHYMPSDQQWYLGFW